MAKRAKRKPNRTSEAHPPAAERVTNVIQLPVRAELPPPVVEPPPPPPPPEPVVTQAPARVSHEPHRPRRRGRRSSLPTPSAQGTPVAGSYTGELPVTRTVEEPPSRPAAPPAAPAQTAPAAVAPPTAAPVPTAPAVAASPVVPAPGTPVAVPPAAAPVVTQPAAPAVTPPAAAAPAPVVAAEAPVAPAPAAQSHVASPTAVAVPAVTPAPAPTVATPSAHEPEHADDEAFFSRPPAHDAFDDFEAAGTGEIEGLHRRSKSFYAALGILAGGVLSIGGFILYNKVLMPTPEDLGPVAVALPTPDTLRNLDDQLAAAQAQHEAALQKAPTQAAAVPPSTVAASPAPAESAPVPPSEPEAAAPAEPAAAPAEVAPVQPVEAEPPPTEPAPSPAAFVQEAPAAPVAVETAPLAYEQLLAAARKQGFKRSAEATYLQALGVYPQGVEALSGLSMLYLNLGKNAEARDRARQALALDPTNAEAWIVLGAALDVLGDRPGAREAYQKCAALPLEGPFARYVGECKRMLR